MSAGVSPVPGEAVEAWGDSDRRDVAAWLIREADDRVKFFPQRRDGVDALIRHLADIARDPAALREGIAAEVLGPVRELVSDWNANGNSRELGDPTAGTWHEAARQLLDRLPAPVQAAEEVDGDGDQ